MNPNEGGNVSDTQLLFLVSAALAVLGAPQEGPIEQAVPAQLQWVLNAFPQEEGICKRWHEALRPHLGEVAFLRVRLTPDGQAICAQWVERIEYLPNFTAWYLGAADEEPTPERVAAIAERIPKAEAA
jgi:acyl-CoA reductase-like NAD-dependent aldehyde dehydrogenase